MIAPLTRAKTNVMIVTLTSRITRPRKSGTATGAPIRMAQNLLIKASRIVMAQNLLIKASQSVMMTVNLKTRANRQPNTTINRATKRPPNPISLPKWAARPMQCQNAVAQTPSQKIWGRMIGALKSRVTRHRAKANLPNPRPRKNLSNQRAKSAINPSGWFGAICH